jgi:tellurite resistance protein
MSSINTVQSDGANAIGVTFVSRPGPRALDAMIAVAAEMALADGRADVVEHRGLLSFMRQQKILVSVGRSETNRRFTSELQRATEQAACAEFLPDPSIRWQDLTDRLRPFAGMHAAGMIAAAAAHVAAADGVVHPEETALLRSLYGALELDPILAGHQA